MEHSKNMDIREFAYELVETWHNRENIPDQGLDGIPENHEAGILAEKTVLRKLRNRFEREKTTKFTRTPNSWSPADIVGIRRSQGVWHFALYQVKSSIYEDTLTPDIPEKETLPQLANLLKQNFGNLKSTSRIRQRPIYITIGYVGVVTSGNRNKVVKASPYQNRYTLNDLQLTNQERTSLSNVLHRII
ncbi:MAG: hypothetical protein Roseis2KO_32800 [Roseivirga sp.]